MVRQALPLTGLTVAVTAERRGEDFAAALVRNGATVRHAPAIRMIPLADDAELKRATRAVLQAPPDIVVATTAVGFRGWLEAAENWGHGDQLRGLLQGSRVLARGPKTTGAVRAAGLREQWSPEGESSAEVVQQLQAEGVVGLRIAVQLHGADTQTQYDVCAELRGLGAEVVAVPVYRWTLPSDPAPMDRLIEACFAGEIDAVTFTSAAAVAGMLGRAEATGVPARLLNVLRGGWLLVVCVGSVTAAPLQALGVATVQPPRARLGALARYVVETLPAHRSARPQ